MKFQNSSDITLQQKKENIMLGQIDFLNRLFLNARTFICWLANFFVLFFLEDARILIFFSS